MYQHPKLEYYGTLRELTQVGTSGAQDALIVAGIVSAQGNGPINVVCDANFTNCHAVSN